MFLFHCFNCCFVTSKRSLPENVHVLYCHVKLVFLLTLLCVWIMGWFALTDEEEEDGAPGTSLPRPLQPASTASGVWRMFVSVPAGVLSLSVVLAVTEP